MPEEELLRRLAELESQSAERVATLRQLAADVPATMSRRALLKAMVSDLRSNTDRRAFASRVGRRVLGLPRRVARRLSGLAHAPDRSGAD